MQEQTTEITIDDWIRNRNANIELIKNNLIQIQMAKRVIELCDESIEVLKLEEQTNTANLE